MAKLSPPSTTAPRRATTSTCSAPRACAATASPGAPADGWVEAIYRHCQVTTIYGGTSEVCRGVIAERGLGLPRNR